MVDVNEFVNLQQGNTEKAVLKLATVSALSETATAMVTFYGEETESQKGYSYLSTYEPVLDDTVLMVSIADTYIIFGKILLQTDNPSGIITTAELEEILDDYLTQAGITTILEGYALVNHTHSTYALTAHTHSTYSLTTHNHDTVYAAEAHTHSSLKKPGYNPVVGLDNVVNGVPIFSTSASGVSLGSSTYKWAELYSVNGTINTSDKRHKKAIHSISNKYNALFEKLRPVTYKFKKNRSNRIHIGFIAQEVEETLNDIGMSSGDFAGFIKSPIEGKQDFEYGLRYSEFIALNTHMIQQLMQRVKYLEDKLKEGDKING